MEWLKQIQVQMAELNSWPKVLNFIGQKGIANNAKFIAYCVVLTLLYITIIHRNENQMRNLTKTIKQLKELGWQYKDEKSKLMFLTKESELAKSAAPLGLQLNVEVPQKIVVTAATNP